jgi:hypothetical protein
MSHLAFDHSLDFKASDFRKHPKRYRIGNSEQGVQLVEPYKSEIMSDCNLEASFGAQEDQET